MAATVDVRALRDANAQRGIGTYVRNLVAGLGDRSDVAVRTASGAAPLRVVHGRRRVFHSPALAPPAAVRGTWVQTIHDLLPLVEPDQFAADRGRWERLAGRTRRATQVIAVSQHSADQAVDVLRIPENRVTVVYHGVDERFSPSRVRENSAAPFILYVGEYGPHKGFREAFAVAGRLASLGYPHTLQLAGRIAPWVRDDVNGAFEAAGRPTNVELLGFVGDVLPLYQRARALIVTSRHEGFGLPALEAMATGTPVVAFRNSATAEIVASGGVLVRDGDVGELVRALRPILDDPARWREASTQARRRATAFSWTRAVDGHVAVYRSALRRHDSMP